MCPRKNKKSYDQPTEWFDTTLFHERELWPHEKDPIHKRPQCLCDWRVTPPVWASVFWAVTSYQVGMRMDVNNEGKCLGSKKLSPELEVSFLEYEERYITRHLDVGSDWAVTMARMQSAWNPTLAFCPQPTQKQQFQVYPDIISLLSSNSKKTSTFLK